MGISKVTHVIPLGFLSEVNPRGMFGYNEEKEPSMNGIRIRETRVNLA